MKKLPETFGRYEIKFLPLHPLSKSKQRWLTLFLEHFYKTLIDKRVEEHIFLKYKHKGERDEKRNTL